MAQDPAERTLLAGAVTGLMLAAFVLGTRALFFFGDSGFPDFNRGRTGPVRRACPAAIAPTAATSSPSRKISRPPASRTPRRLPTPTGPSRSTARLLFLMTTGAALFGGVLFGIAGPRRA